MKSCPFCAKNTTIVVTEENEFRVHCRHCGALGPNEITFERAERMWELRRFPEPQPHELFDTDSHYVKSALVHAERSAQLLREMLVKLMDDDQWEPGDELDTQAMILTATDAEIKPASKGKL